MNENEPLVFKIISSRHSLPTEVEKDEKYTDYLDKQIAKTRVELMQVYTLLRSTKAGKRRKEKRLRSANCPLTICDQCCVSYPQMMVRPYQLDTSWPEVNICNYCRKLILFAGGAPTVYRKWFPERFDEYGRVK